MSCLFQARDLRVKDNGPFNFKLEAGERVGITGSSGTGKTMLLRALADLDPHEGRIYLDGEELSALAPPRWRRQVAMLPAESRWWKDSVGEHFETGTDVDWGALGFEEDVASWPIRRLSSGERQRLSLLRLLAIQPKVLLLDEPTANLDEDNTRRVENLINRYQAQTQAAVLWVGHDHDQLRRLCSRTCELKQGNLHPLPLN